MLGSVLNLKPILELRDGAIDAVAKVRTRRSAQEMVYEILDARLLEGDKVHMAVLNVAAPGEAARFKEQLKARFNPVEIMETECSPTIGAHAGPGTIRVVYYVE